LPETIKEDLWVLTRLGIKVSLTDGSKTKLKNSAYLIAQALSNNTTKTFACSHREFATPNLYWMNHEATTLVYSEDYPIITLKEFLYASDLKPPIAKGDVEVEILKQCNGSLNQYTQKFWMLISDSHAPLQSHFNAGDKLLSIHYSDRYLYSPWTVILISTLISGLKNHMGDNWNHPLIQIDSAPKLSNEYKRNGLFADYLDDSLRLDVIEAVFYVLNETCNTHISSDCPHGRLMYLKWESGKTTTLRFDQGISYWGCDGRLPWYDNSIPAAEQVGSLIRLMSNLKVKNYKDHPTQVFIKERDKP